MRNINLLLALLRRHHYSTFKHCRNVANLISEWATDMDFSESEICKAYDCGLMHDIGKLYVSCQVLYKPGQLTANEWAVIKKHPTYGYELLNFVGLAEISHIIRYHHERYDGAGYGEGLKAAQIPLMSRMLAICDAFDAMTSKRCYTKSMNRKQALQEIEKYAGSQFDPLLSPYFIRFAAKEKSGALCDIL